MEIIFPHTDVKIRLGTAVELLASVDGKTIRISIDWSALERLLGMGKVDEDAVRDFLRLKRDQIELAARAHLFAQGVPLNRLLSLTFDELRGLAPAVARSPDD